MKSLWSSDIKNSQKNLATTKKPRKTWIGFIILLVGILIPIFLLSGRPTTAKQMREKISKIFGSKNWPVRIGYMGAGMILAAHWTLEPILFVAGFSCVLVQVTYRKQWNLVVLNINGLVAWITHYLN